MATLSDGIIECKHVTHVPATEYRPDIHIVKEVIHGVDGDIPNIKIIKNYKRPFWITKKPHRNNVDKKEWESIKKLTQYDVTESELYEKARQALEIPKQSKQNQLMRMVNSSPYIYGTKVSSSTLIFQKYKDFHPSVTPYTTCMFDTETLSVPGDFGEIMIAQAAIGNECKLICLRSWIGEGEHHTELMRWVDKYLRERLPPNYHIDFEIVDDLLVLVKTVFGWIHQRKPDILAIWNQLFDIERILETCEKYQIKPEDVFSDPALPEALRYFTIIRGQTVKRKHDGSEQPIPLAEQWHQVKTTSSFIIVDAMCVYRRLRLSQQMKKTKLDIVLKNELGLGKLMFKDNPEVDTELFEDGLEWHMIMREKYKYAYLCYSIWDVAGMQALDAKTKDLSMSFPVYMGITDWEHARSNPRKILDGMHFYTLKHQHVLGVASPVEQEFTTLGMKNWILLLDSDNVRPENTGYIIEDPSIHTTIRLINADTDSVSAYPSAGIATNSCKQTTYAEISQTPPNMDSMLYRYENMNVVSGAANSLEYCFQMFNFPLPKGLNPLET